MLFHLIKKLPEDKTDEGLQNFIKEEFFPILDFAIKRTGLDNIPKFEKECNTAYLSSS